MFKKLLALLFCYHLTLFTAFGGGTVVYNDYLINENVVYDQSPEINLNDNSIGQLSAQVNYSSASYSQSTANNGSVSTMSLTITNNNVLAKSQSTGTFTIAENSLIQGSSATNTITISTNSALQPGVTITVNAINTIIAGYDFDIGVSSPDTAANMARALNGLAYGLVASVSSTTAPGVITLYVNQFSSQGNTYTLSTSTDALTLGASVFSGGRDPVNLSINNYPVLGNINFQQGRTSSDTAKSISDFAEGINQINSVIRTTWTAGGVVSFTAKNYGSAYNYPITTSSQTIITAGYLTSLTNGAAAASITGGRDNSFFSINGISFYQGTGVSTFTAGSTSTDTAKSISNAIMANSSLNSIIRSTWTTDGVVTATSTATGSNKNYALFTSTQAALTLHLPVTLASNGSATGTMKGGANSNWDLLNSEIDSANNFDTGLPVLFATVSGTPPGALTSGTTYYAIYNNANSFSLATSLVNAAAGTKITISSQAATSGSFTFTALPISGNSSFKWQASNDCENWLDVSASSVTVTPTTAANSFGWDFGTVNYKCMRVPIIAPTSGGVRYQIILNGKS